METTNFNQSNFKQSDFKQAYFQASIVLSDNVISTVLVRDFLTASYYLGILKRLHLQDMLYYTMTCYTLTSEQVKQINADSSLLGYSYFSNFK